MREIIFSVFEPGENIAYLNTLISQFEQEQRIRVKIEEFSWLDGWKRLLDATLYGSGPDVSEVGSTWVVDLAHMNALRPFSPTEIEKIVAQKNYFPSSWIGAKTVDAGSHPVTWAVPFFGDARVVYYRRSHLEQVGVDENIAFQSITNFENTLSKLKANGIENALALATEQATISLQNLASWIWHAKGDLLSPDGTTLTFDQPEALAGIETYFRLGNYLGQQRLGQVDAEDLFCRGNASVVVSGHWILGQISDPAVRDDLGVAPILGPEDAFVGPEHLVIWKNSRHPEIALELIQFLCRTKSSELLFPAFGLPPFKEGWDRPPFARPEYRIQMQALQSGRSYPESRLWALVEKRLTDAMPHIWSKVFADPTQSDKIVEREIISLANRLRVTLES